MNTQPAEEPFAKLEVLPDSNSYLGKLDSKKKRFVLLYTKLNGHITNTCAGIGIDRQTYYNWLDHENKDFANAISEAELSLNDEIRDVLINKAASGDMTGVIFYLKNRHPDFKPQPTTLIQNNFSQSLQKEKDEFGI
jgi:hypothetical protein